MRVRRRGAGGTGGVRPSCFADEFRQRPRLTRILPVEGGDELVSVGDEPDGLGGDFVRSALVTLPSDGV